MRGDVTDDFALGVAGFRFADLYNPQRLKDLHAEFWVFAEGRHAGIVDRFAAAEAELPRPQQSEVLMEVATVFGEFVAQLFHIIPDVQKLADDTQAINRIFQFKQDFLRPRVFKRFGEPAVDDERFHELDTEAKRLLSAVPEQPDPEARFAEMVLALLQAEKGMGQDSQLADRICGSLPGESLPDRAKECLLLLGDSCVQVNATPERRERVAGWVSFVRPHNLDFEHLVQITRPDENLPEAIMGPPEHRRHRDGFQLTDPRMNRKEYLREIDYCIICHPREKDSCSHGFRDKAGQRTRNPLGIPLTGCPLEERISEMHELRKHGDAIAALAMVMLDNPM